MLLCGIVATFYLYCIAVCHRIIILTNQHDDDDDMQTVADPEEGR